MKKRLISMLLTVLMVASLFGGMSVSAYADEEYATQEYTLKSGDTLLKVCNKLGLNWYSCQTAINKLNNISEAQYRKLSVGQVITLPATNEDAVKIAKATISSGSTTGGTVITGGTGSTGSSTSGSASASGVNAAYWLIPYTMQKGETVAGVCNVLGISFATYSEQIKTINNISSWSKVAAGKTLLLPSASAPAAGTSCYAVVAHQIQKGETTYSICNQYGISYNANASLMQTLNKGTSLTNIKYGRTLYVPVATVTGSSSIGSGSTGSGSTGSGSTGSGSTGSGSSSSGSGSSTTKTYKLSTGTVKNGKISFTVNGKTVTSAAAGSTVTIVAAPDSMCGLKSVSLKYADGSAVPKVTDSTFTMPECDVVVNASFEKGYYMGAVSAHGTVTLYNNSVATTTAAKGTEITVKVSPDVGYKISRIYVQKNDGTGAIIKDGMKSGDSFTMPDCRVFVRVEYAETATYTLKAEGSSLNGSFKLKVNGAEVTKAAAGATVEVVCSPATGYVALDENITVKNLDYTDKAITVTEGKFIMPAANVQVSVLFTPGSAEKYAIKIVDATEGTATAKADVDGVTKKVEEVEANKKVTLSAELKSAYSGGYYLEKFIIKSSFGTEEKTGNPATFEMPCSDVTITPVFKPKTATVTGITYNDESIAKAVVTANGRELSTGSSISVGESLKVSVPSMKPGYLVDTITVYYKDMDGVDQAQMLSEGGSMTVPACSQLSVSVKFKATLNNLNIKSDWGYGCFQVTYNGKTETVTSTDIGIAVPTNTSVKFEPVSGTDGDGKKVEIEIVSGLTSELISSAGDEITKMPGNDCIVKIHLK